MKEKSAFTPNEIMTHGGKVWVRFGAHVLRVREVRRRWRLYAALSWAVAGFVVAVMVWS